MSISTVADLVDLLRQGQVLPDSQLKLLEEVSGDCPDPRTLADILVEQNWLTPYQTEQLFAEGNRNLVLGPYVLLEPLGEGGMGQVFKARHQALERTVALKVIRQEHLAQDPEAIRRFQREAKAAALLQHANVVVVYDSGHIGSIYYIAMQYLEGIDLSRLVKEHGPLPVWQACDFVRQAALGLQHAHEHSMVHRDIKPSNLLATQPTIPRPPTDGDAEAEMASASTIPGGPLARIRKTLPIRPIMLQSGSSVSGKVVIKILDMGLVRMVRAQDMRSANQSLTQEGSMVGTPDYIAPEQARNAHRVDIRADLYSLGCTFYYLLTGRAPFTEGTAIEKLLMHQLDEPPAVEELRPEVSREVGAIVRKLMAKRPMDRFQVPSEVAEVLAPFAVPPKEPPKESAPPPPPAKVDQTPSPASSVHRPSLTPPANVKPAAHGHAASVFHWSPTPQTVIAKTPETEEEVTGPEAVKPLAILKGHAGCVTSIAFSPNRDLLASGAVNGQVLIWDFSGKKPGQKAQIAVLRDAIHALAFSPDNRRLAMGSGAHDGFVWLWDVSLETPAGLAVLQGHQGPVDCLAFSPDGKQLASGGSDKTVRVWDVGGTRFISRAVFKGHTQPIKAVAFSPDNHSLASGSQDCTVRLWNLGRTLWSKERAILQGHEAQINDVAFAPNGTAIASISQDQSIGVWDVTQVQPREKMWLEGHVGPGRIISFSADSRTIVSVSDGHQVILWDALNGAKLREWQLPKTLVNSYCFTNDARYVATGSSEGPVGVYRLGEKRASHTHQGGSKPASS